jgi:hypothetical protein
MFIIIVIVAHQFMIKHIAIHITAVVMMVMVAADISILRLNNIAVLWSHPVHLPTLDVLLGHKVLLGVVLLVMGALLMRSN